MRSIRGLGLAFALLSAFAMASPAASAQPRRARPAQKKPDPEEARLREGKALFEAKDFAKAAAEFERVYQSTKDPKAAYWRARSLEEAGEKAAAVRVYKKLLAELGAASADAQEVVGRIQDLSAQVAIVTVTAPEGATITVDGVEVGKAPLGEPVYVDAGKHTIAATRGEAATAKTIEVAEEARVAVDLSAKSSEPVVPPAVAAPPATTPAAPPSAAEPAPPSRDTTTARSNTLTYVGFAGAGALALGSIVFAVATAGSASDFDTKKGELGVTRKELDGLQGDTQRNFALSIGLGAAAVALAGVTLFVFDKKGASQKETATRVIVTGQGALVQGGF